MKTAGELFEDAILHWRDNNGIGTAIIPKPLNDKIMILGILQRIYNSNPFASVLIITQTFSERIEIIEFLTQQPNSEENNKQFKDLIEQKCLKIFSNNLIKNYKTNIIPLVSIVYHCDDIFDELFAVLSKTKFKLVILDKIMQKSEDMNKLYSICPLLNDFKQNEIDEIRTTTPVEDMWIGITIPEDSETYKLLNYYNEYITTSLNIFGSFDIMQQANIGNTQLNISANQICANIAQENGWNEHLDMSVEINVQLDELYNPASIKERASQTYEIIRNRAQLLSDYEGKLVEILKIVKEHKDEKILIINKRGEFANKVTDYINEYSDTIICGNYHDKVEPIPTVDKYGNPVLYKSGPNKGKLRYMAAKAQKTYNEQLFNIGKLNVLSTTSAPDKTLSINVDIIIITSPQCESIKNYMYRLSNVYYNNNELKLYNIYIKNSLEETKLQNKELAKTHQIVNKCENNVISENNSDFVIVD